MIKTWDLEYLLDLCPASVATHENGRNRLIHPAVAGDDLDLVFCCCGGDDEFVERQRVSVRITMNIHEQCPRAVIGNMNMYFSNKLLICDGGADWDQVAGGIDLVVNGRSDCNDGTGVIVATRTFLVAGKIKETNEYD